MLSAFAFALLSLIFGASALAVALVVTRRARLEIEQRVNLVAGVEKLAAPGETLRALVKARARIFDDYVRRFFTLGMKRTWAMRTGGAALLAVAFGAGLAIWIVARHFFDLSALASAALSAASSYLAPRLILGWQQGRTEQQFIDLFPDAVDTVSRMLRAGLPMTAAVRTVAVEGSPPVNAVFTTIADQLKIGVPIEETLDSSSREIGLPDFRFFTVAVALQYATGGNLTTTLDILSEIIRKRRALRLKAKAATGEIRITAYTLSGIPIVTVGMLMVMQPSYLTPLWIDPRGHWIVGMAGAGIVLAVLSMRAMMRSVTKF